MKNYFQLTILATFGIFHVGCGNYDEELKQIPEYVTLTETVKSLKTFEGFAPMQSWRLLIDGRRQHEGPFVFDKTEPGYLAGLAKGMNYALVHRDDPLTVELLEEMRRQATESVSKTNDTNFQKEIGGAGVTVNLITGSNTTSSGLYEFREKIKNNANYRDLVSISNDNSGQLFFGRSAIDRAKLYPIVKNILDTYENSERKIKDLVIVSQDLEQLHPFNDGNARTFVILLIQKELARFDLKPAVFYDPNRFDAWSVHELVEDVAEAQETFQTFVNQKQP